MADSAKGATQVAELTRGQGLVARRAAESRATVPDLTLGTEVAMDACVALVAGRPAGAATPMDLVVRACALALREQPRVNGAYRDARWEAYERVNVAVAVGEDPPAFVTLFDADRRPAAELAEATRALAARVQDGSVTSPELAGATFTVSAVDGVRRLTTVLVPPQAAGLGVGAVTRRPVVSEGDVVVAGWAVDLSLACDHRVLYPDQGAAFLARVDALLQAPEAL